MIGEYGPRLHGMCSLILDLCCPSFTCIGKLDKNLPEFLCNPVERARIYNKTEIVRSTSDWDFLYYLALKELNSLYNFQAPNSILYQTRYGYKDRT